MMKKKTCLLALFAALALYVGCAGKPAELAALDNPIPYKDAALMEGSGTVNGVSVAAVRPGKDDMKKLLAGEVEKAGYLPVLVYVSNASKNKILVEGLATRLTTPEGELAPEPLRNVYDHLTYGSGNVQAYTLNEAITMNFFNKGLGETVLEPGKSAYGFVFFDAKKAAGTPRSIKVHCQRLSKIEYFSIEASVR